MPLDTAALRQAFPALQVRVGGKLPIYLDSACTSLRPEPVIRAMADFQRRAPACHGRSNHAFGRETSRVYEGARDYIRRFVGAEEAAQIVFVRNTTEALNLVAESLPLKHGDVVLTTNLEHNSNLLPWQRRVKRDGLVHRVHRIDVARGFDLAAFKRDLPGVAVVAVPHVSNLTGIELPVADIAAAAREVGATVVVDGAQAVCTHPLDLRRTDIDFYAFSFHKMFGPTGIGALYGRRDALESLQPFLVGGGTVDDASFGSATWEPLPMRLEAGICNYDGAVGAATAAAWLTKVGQGALHEHVVKLNRIATEGLRRLPRLRILGPEDPARRGGVFSFHVEGVESEAIARLLDTRENIMVRHGKLCVHAWFADNEMPDACRASFSAYNTEAEVRAFVRTVRGAVDLVR